MGRIGVTMICSRVPTSRSRTIAKAVRLTTSIRVKVPMTPGTKNHRPFEVGVVPGSRAAADLRRCRADSRLWCAPRQIAALVTGELATI